MKSRKIWAVVGVHAGGTPQIHHCTGVEPGICQGGWQPIRGFHKENELRERA